MKVSVDTFQFLGGKDDAPASNSAAPAANSSAPPALTAAGKPASQENLDEDVPF